MIKIKYDYLLNTTTANNKGEIMKLIKYNSYNDIIVEFQDEYSAQVHTRIDHFLKGSVRNPYYPDVYGIACLGQKYPSSVDKKAMIEYKMWHSMIMRCYDPKLKEYRPTYEDVTCCDEWLNYENFYEWIHTQPNFNKITIGTWNLDKDIIKKGNKIYSPEYCCLVPSNVNVLFIKKNANRGEYPIGVSYYKQTHKFKASCSNPITKKYIGLGYTQTPEEAFVLYKNYKEALIKEVAEQEYKNNNITKKCYEAMMQYQVEITD